MTHPSADLSSCSCPDCYDEWAEANRPAHLTAWQYQDLVEAQFEADEARAEDEAVAAFRRQIEEWDR